jgi:radical SAM protein with 4Fe4S-binding SPASM domain
MNLPPVIRIEPASSCNLRCKHCPTGLGKSPSGIMEKSLFDKIFLEISNYKSEISMIVLYHGGEPLLNTNLTYFIKQIKTLGLKTKIVTNGKLLDSAKSLSLIQSGLDQIEISLDGLSPEESEDIRVRSDAKVTLRAIHEIWELKKIQNSSIDITISTTQFIDDYGYSYINKQAPIPGWLREELPPQVRVKSTWAIQWPGAYPSNDHVIYEQKLQHKPKACSLLDETLTIRANGDVVACCYDLTSMKTLGNVNDKSLIEIVSSDLYLKFRSNFYSGIFEGPCSTCAVVTGKKFLGKRQLLEVSLNKKL